MKDTSEQVKVVRTQGYQLCDALSNLSVGLCDSHNVDGVAFIINKRNELERLLRHIDARFGSS